MLARTLFLFLSAGPLWVAVEAMKVGAAVAGAVGLVALQQQLSPLSVDAQGFCCCQAIYGCLSCTYYDYQCGAYCDPCKDNRNNYYYCYDPCYNICCGDQVVYDGCTCYHICGGP